MTTQTVKQVLEGMLAQYSFEDIHKQLLQLRDEEYKRKYKNPHLYKQVMYQNELHKFDKIKETECGSFEVYKEGVLVKTFGDDFEIIHGTRINDE